MTRRSPRGALLTPGTGYRRAEPKETYKKTRAATDEVPPTKGNMTLYLVIGGVTLLTITGVVIFIKRKK